MRPAESTRRIARSGSCANSGWAAIGSAAPIREGRPAETGGLGEEALSPRRPGNTLPREQGDIRVPLGMVRTQRALAFGSHRHRALDQAHGQAVDLRGADIEPGCKGRSPFGGWPPSSAETPVSVQYRDRPSHLPRLWIDRYKPRNGCPRAV